MMNNNLKKITNNFIKKYKVTSVDYPALRCAAEKMGYTVIEFNSIINDSDVEIVIKNLCLSENILNSKGFTYVSTDYRLIFVNEDLNNEEKLLILSHEIGHIVCNHFSMVPIIGKDVKDEHEANEFSHYLLKQSNMRRIKDTIAKHSSFFIASIVLVCLITGISAGYMIIQNKSVYADNLYVTVTGKCYHKKECIYIKNKSNIKKLTKQDFESGKYTPCNVCLPNKK